MNSVFVALVGVLLSCTLQRHASAHRQQHAPQSYSITVDASKTQRELRHFWRSTGFCPPLPHNKADVFDLSRDQQLNLAYIASVPHTGIEQVRIHWLLELVTIREMNGKLLYNFTHLDNLIHLLWQNGLMPGFELMGNPSGYFTNFEQKVQVFEWKKMVTLLARRYIDKYGVAYLSKWNFETWNEPDHHDFDNLTFTIRGFQNYYDACSEGLKDANTLLQLGGPGDSCHPPPHSPISWGLLNHCYNGTNFFTGEIGVRLDYIALHKKGAGSSFHILEQELDTVQQIQKRFPKFQSIPIYNDEADPLVGWSIPKIWRAEVTYAAMVVKVIAQHQNLLISNPQNKINFTLLSNDNGFLNYYPNYFTQRTLTARFQMNNTNPPHVQMVRKPVLTIMGLLALLGEKQLEVEIMLNDDASENSTLGAIASIHEPSNSHASDSWQSAIIIYNSDDNRTSSDITLVTVNLTNFPTKEELVYVIYHLDNNNTNPYLQWKNLRRPDFPTVEQFLLIREMEDPVVKGPIPFPPEGNLVLKLHLPIPSVYLLHICAKPERPPNQTSGVSFIPLTLGQVAITWNDDYVNSKCLKTFEVEFSVDGNVYKRINDKDTIFTIFVYSPLNKRKERSQVSGFYRIRAVDYWVKTGEYSDPVQYIEGKH
ncbi:alpha-L-iduronidase isoform X1 [Scyliorhinus canicula]|uniref:alpha-L-iduronidase isoform X1 n=2 Tax=Scyliorhinus canicula TaxID=7830 RepID=UPI0018F5BF8B|nr:alpha-L-iduronidase isoform X1 [Scyliorhinus canicula]